MDHYSENVFLFNSTFHCETLNANCIYEDKNVLVFGPPPPPFTSITAAFKLSQKCATITIKSSRCQYNITIHVTKS